MVMGYIANTNGDIYIYTYREPHGNITGIYHLVSSNMADSRFIAGKIIDRTDGFPSKLCMFDDWRVIPSQPCLQILQPQS